MDEPSRDGRYEEQDTVSTIGHGIETLGQEASSPSFGLSASEKAYLSYFAMGDLNVRPHGRKIRAIVGTTHPSMLNLVLDTFGPYGRSMVYPATNPSGYEWRLACDLPREFAFLAKKAFVAPGIEEGKPLVFLEALSGFGDAEGHAGLRESRGLAWARFTASNRVRGILESFKAGLSILGISSSVSALGSQPTFQYQLEVSGENALKLLKLIRFRHPEKVRAAGLVKHYAGAEWDLVSPIYKRFRLKIKREVQECVNLAKLASQVWPLRSQRRHQEFVKRVTDALEMDRAGFEKSQISFKIGRSERTVYRYLSYATGHGDERTSNQNSKSTH